MALLETTMTPEVVPEETATTVTPITTTVPEPTTVEPVVSEPEPLLTQPVATDYVTPESLVSNQLSSLLNTDNLVMRQAAERSKEEAGRLGLLSSSMAVGAGQGAMAQSMLPIAQQDAETYARSGLAKQTQEAEMTKIEANVAADLKLQKMRDDNAMLLQKTQAGATADLQAAQNVWDANTKTALATLDHTYQTALNDQSITQQRYDSAMDSISGIMQNTQTNINAILTDPDITLMAPDVVASMLTSVQDHATASLEFIGGVGQIPEADLSVLIDTFNSATQWT